MLVLLLCFFFFQAEDGIRDLVRSRGLGDVYKRQAAGSLLGENPEGLLGHARVVFQGQTADGVALVEVCLLYTSDAADERSSVDLGGRRIIKKKKQGVKGRGELHTKRDRSSTIL